MFVYGNAYGYRLLLANSIQAWHLHIPLHIGQLNTVLAVKLFDKALEHALFRLIGLELPGQ
ncbi:hypothetical protein D3C86_1318000 [compost metagenome]